MSKTAMTAAQAAGESTEKKIERLERELAASQQVCCIQSKSHSDTMGSLMESIRALRRCYDKLQPLPRETPCTPEENFVRWVKEMGQ